MNENMVLSSQITPKHLTEEFSASKQHTPNEPSPFNLSDEEFWEEWGQDVQLGNSVLKTNIENEAGIEKRRIQLGERPFPFNKMFTETPPYHPYEYEEDSPTYPVTPENFVYSNLSENNTPNQYQSDINESPSDSSQESFWREWAEEFKTPPSSMKGPLQPQSTNAFQVFTPEEGDMPKLAVSTPSPNMGRANCESPDSGNLPSLAFVTVRRTGRQDRRLKLNNTTPGSPLNPNNHRVNNRSNLTNVTERFSAVQLDSEDEENNEDPEAFSDSRLRDSPALSNDDEVNSPVGQSPSTPEIYTPAPRGRRRMVIISDEESECDEESITENRPIVQSPQKEDFDVVESDESDFELEHETLEFNVDSEATVIETNSSLNCTPEKFKENTFDSPEELFTVKRRHRVNRLLVVDSDDELDSGALQSTASPFQAIEVDLNDSEFNTESKSDEFHTTPNATLDATPNAALDATPNAALDTTPNTTPYRDTPSRIIDSPEVIKPKSQLRRRLIIDSDDDDDETNEKEDLLSDVSSENEEPTETYESSSGDEDSGVIV
ncbi:hypothetical protein K7432_015716 [Basidiobolus ranarum]|uniref:Uncharacterized protein n=1 Tax=Basidiobolus ranarum TaxID=34480 RepID=A0ABR2VNJ4_9FUNG